MSTDEAWIRETLLRDPSLSMDEYEALADQARREWARLTKIFRRQNDTVVSGFSSRERRIISVDQAATAVRIGLEEAMSGPTPSTAFKLRRRLKREAFDAAQRRLAQPPYKLAGIRPVPRPEDV